MANIPDDIFTEAGDVSPDTLANLGPLRRLAGVWQSDQGECETEGGGARMPRLPRACALRADRPQSDDTELLYGLRYHIHINTAEEANTFHDQVGY